MTNNQKLICWDTTVTPDPEQPARRERPADRLHPGSALRPGHGEHRLPGLATRADRRPDVPAVGRDSLLVAEDSQGDQEIRRFEGKDRIHHSLISRTRRNCQKGDCPLFRSFCVPCADASRGDQLRRQLFCVAGVILLLAPSRASSGPASRAEPAQSQKRRHSATRTGHSRKSLHDINDDNEFASSVDTRYFEDRRGGLPVLELSSKLLVKPVGPSRRFLRSWSVSGSGGSGRSGGSGPKFRRWRICNFVTEPTRPTRPTRPT